MNRLPLLILSILATLSLLCTQSPDFGLGDTIKVNCYINDTLITGVTEKSRPVVHLGDEISIGLSTDMPDKVSGSVITLYRSSGVAILTSASVPLLGTTVTPVIKNYKVESTGLLIITATINLPDNMTALRAETLTVSGRPANFSGPDSLLTPSPAVPTLALPFSLTATATGSLPLKYQWFKNNILLDTLLYNSNLFSIAALTYSDVGLYQCKATNIWGSDTSNSFRLSLPPQTYTITISPALHGTVTDSANTPVPTIMTVAAGSNRRVFCKPDPLYILDSLYVDSVKVAYDDAGYLFEAVAANHTVRPVFKLATVSVTGVTLDQTALTLAAGGATGTLVATVTPVNATNKIVNWSTTNESVATVVNGVITPKTVGTTAIIATTVDGGKAVAALITVVTTTIPVTSISLDPPALTLVAGGVPTTLTATILPVNATNKNIVWSTNNEAVTSVVNGVVTPLSVGTVAITATTVDGAKVATATIAVVATTVPVTSVLLDSSKISITLGSAPVSLAVSVLPANATNKNLLWSSSADSVASVVNGVVTPKLPGTTTVTVASVDGGKTTTCVVTVLNAPVAVTSVSLDQTAITMVVGGAAGTLVATVLPANASNKAVAWSSSDPAIATVSGGVVTPVAIGKATITATTVDGAKKVSCEVTVVAAPILVTAVSIDVPTLNLTLGGATGTLTATVLPANATNKGVTWSSSSEAVATVVGGVVTAKGVGSATITVTTVEGGKVATAAVTVVAATLIPSTIIFADATPSKVLGSGVYTNPISGVGAGQITFTSGTPSVATVTATGEVTLISIGTTLITAVKAATPTHTAATNTYTLTVTALVVAPKITTEPVNLSVAEGGVATFAVVASGTTPQYLWQKGTVDIPSALSATYTIPSVTVADDRATYRCIVSNAAGKDTSEYGTLTVLPLPSVPVITSVTTGDATATAIWNSVAGATSYNLYYKAGATVDKATGTKIVGAVSPSVISSLVNGTQYAFAVSAVSANGESALSAVCTATPQVFVITASVPLSGGTVTPTGDIRVVKGADATFNIKPNMGYNILNVMVDGVADSDAKAAKQKIFTNVTAAHTITASFVIKQYSLIFQTNTGSGTITATANGTAVASGALVDSGASISLTAVPAANYTFTSWTGGITGAANLVTFVMNEAKTITANYTINTHALLVTCNPATGGGTVIKNPAAGPYTHGTSVTLTAVPAPGYKLGAWSGSATGSSSPVSVLMDADKSVSAIFTHLYTYTVTFDGQSATQQANPQTVTVESPATTVVTLPTEPTKTGYVFEGWWTGTNGNGTPFLATTTVTENTPVYAKWKQNSFVIGQTYGGGVVFYVDMTGLHGLIATTADIEPAPWGVSGTLISGADGTAIGTGKQNTTEILAGCSDAGIAARVCATLNQNGFNDWYLPSKDELNLLYMQRSVVGGFSTTDYYWSSTEISNINALWQSFANGAQLGGNKGMSLRFRPIRSF